jgi:thymidylate kinase
MPNHTIIAFEGLDCSFKETNFKAFVSHLRDMRDPSGFNIITESFPRYRHPAAYHLEQWLGNRYDRSLLKAHPSAVDSFYSIDRFDYWYNKPNYEEVGDPSDYRWIDIVDGKVSADKFTYFVFDRYNLSNTIYNPIYPGIDIRDFTFDSDTYAIPNPNIVVWMRMRSFDVLCNLLAQKQNKDANELDTEFLRGVWERSEAIIQSDIFDKLGIKLIVVDCLDEDLNIKSRDEICEYIWEQICKAVKY